MGTSPHPRNFQPAGSTVMQQSSRAAAQDLVGCRRWRRAPLPETLPPEAHKPIKMETFAPHTINLSRSGQGPGSNEGLAGLGGFPQIGVHLLILFGPGDGNPMFAISGF